jgi:orotate phosphoribosyltransferase-like protein
LRGTDNPKAKLNEQLVRRAFRLRENGLSTYRIADELGVSRPAICFVLNRKTWRHVDVRISNHNS